MLSIIIPIGGYDIKNRKKRNLLETLDCIETQKYEDYEIILVEETYGGQLYDDLDVDKYISVENESGYMNISWTRNIGANASIGDKLLHIDADIIFDEEYFDKVMSFDKKAFAAWSKCYRLNEDGFDEWILGGFKNIDLKNVFHREHSVIIPKIDHTAGFSNCFDREFYFNKFGGYNENFFGWGGDDNDAVLRYTTLLGKYHILPNTTIYHLPHGGRKAKSGNEKEWLRTKSNPIKINNLILKTKLGNLDRPRKI